MPYTSRSRIYASRVHCSCIAFLLDRWIRLHPFDNVLDAPRRGGDKFLGYRDVDAKSRAWLIDQLVKHVIHRAFKEFLRRSLAENHRILELADARHFKRAHADGGYQAERASFGDCRGKLRRVVRAHSSLDNRHLGLEDIKKRSVFGILNAVSEKKYSLYRKTNC